MFNIFNIFKRKQNKSNNTIIVEKYVVDIYYKNNTMNSFIDNSDTFPMDYRKLLKWYFCRKSESYCLNYSNGGMLVINRNEISKINFYRKEVQEKVKIEYSKNYKI